VFFKDKKVLVTGGAGFIGSNLTERLLKEGCRVRAVLHRAAPVINEPAVEYVSADLTLMDDCRRVVEGVDMVCHCAASTAGAAAIASAPLAHVTPNIVMTSQLMEAAYLAKVKKFLHMSSSVVYPPSGDRPVREDEFFNGNPPEIYFGAGWVKRFAEVLAIFYSQKIKDPMPIIVVRPSNIFGPRDKFDPKTSHVTAALVRRVVQRETPFVVWGTGNDIRDLLYIEDFIDGLLLALNNDKPYLAVNISAGEGHSVKEIIQMLLELDGFTNADLRFDGTKPQMIPVRLIDNTLAVETLGFRQRIGLRTGLQKTIAWFREHGKIWTR
jgi:GDP-L-fucose synthase